MFVTREKGSALRREVNRRLVFLGESLEALRHLDDRLTAFVKPGFSSTDQEVLRRFNWRT